jgi:hypothetical protein
MCVGRWVGGCGCVDYDTVIFQKRKNNFHTQIVTMKLSSKLRLKLENHFGPVVGVWDGKAP